MIGRRATYYRALNGEDFLEPAATIVANFYDHLLLEKDDGTIVRVHSTMLFRLEPLPPAARDAEAALEQAMLACALALEAVRRDR